MVCGVLVLLGRSVSMPRIASSGTGLKSVYCHLLGGSVAVAVVEVGPSARAARLQAVSKSAVFANFQIADFLPAFRRFGMMGSYPARIRRTGMSIRYCTGWP